MPTENQSLARVPVERDELCDLVTWKRRAIEAESKLRTYDPQIVKLASEPCRRCWLPRSRHSWY